jgi:hypothetical protein
MLLPPSKPLYVEPRDENGIFPCGAGIHAGKPAFKQAFLNPDQLMNCGKYTL